LRKQASRLIHGMGDVHPSETKIELLKNLATVLPWASSRCVLGLSGADAIEACLKSAMLATGRHRFVAFSGSYHGLSFGALRLTERRDFHDGFAPWSRHDVAFMPFPLVHDPKQVSGAPLTAAELQDEDRGEGEVAPADVVLAKLASALAARDVAAVVFEPVQGRGGERVLPAGFLNEIQSLCASHGTLLIADEIYTGFGRTGRYFACEHHGVVPDLMALGKALGGGLPLSACTGGASVMDHWPRSQGEARHTQTFLGHPLACALGTATLNALARQLPQSLETLPILDRMFQDFLARERRAKRPAHLTFELRGLAWMRGLWFYRAPAGWAVTMSRRLLTQGFITLPSGPTGRVLSWTPPLTITPKETERFLRAVSKTLDDLQASP
jgi:4-aminobutyrate aminotransferase-like enzyme